MEHIFQVIQGVRVLVRPIHDHQIAFGRIGIFTNEVGYGDAALPVVYAEPIRITTAQKPPPDVGPAVAWTVEVADAHSWICLQKGNGGVAAVESHLADLCVPEL
eukprot:4123119-Prymnesium_polylepis.2